MSVLDDAVIAYLKRRNELIESVCEAALRGGCHGVLIADLEDGSTQAMVNPDVPYGEIHYQLGPIEEIS